MFWQYIFLCFTLCMIECLEVIPSKPEVVYQNEHFFKSLKVDVKRLGRGSPYCINIYAEILSGFGNNLTFSFDTYENLQGHYVPLLFRMEHELCQFFDEPIIGKMIVNQLPNNLSTCPIPPGYYVLPQVKIQLDKFPVKLPFTFEAVEIRARVDIKAHVTKTKEPILHIIFHGRVIQRPKNRKI